MGTACVMGASFQVVSCAWGLSIHGTVASCSVAGPPSGITRHAGTILSALKKEGVGVLGPGRLP